MMLNNKRFKLKKLFSYLSTFCFVTASGSAAAFYDAYPESEGPYTTAPASENLPWLGEDFERYQETQLLECSNNKSPIQHFDITSGCLSAKASGSWKQGMTDDKVFRVVAIAKDELQQEIKYTDQTNQYRAKINSWKKNTTIPVWAGLHAFARYQTSDDLYVASIRYDGNVTIKVKYQGSYTTLAQKKLANGVKTYLDENGRLMTSQWYRINFSAIGTKLTLSLDGIELLSVNNSLLSEGTIGIRTDYVETYLDDWQLLESEGGGIQPPVTPSITPLPTPPPVIEEPNPVSEFIPGKSKVNNGDTISYNGQCYQAKNNPGVWETPSKNSWFWGSVSCPGTPAITPVPIITPTVIPTLAPTPVVTPTAMPTPPVSPVGPTEFVLGLSKVSNGEVVMYKGSCYQAKNNPGSWETPKDNSWFWEQKNCS